MQEKKSREKKCGFKNNFSKKSKNDFVTIFRDAIKKGPYFVCIVWHRCLYRRTVKLFNKMSYSCSLDNIFRYIKSSDSNFYICITCDKYLKKEDIPCQAVWNK